MNQRDEKRIEISLRISMPCDGRADPRQVVVTHDPPAANVASLSAATEGAFAALAIHEPANGQDWKVKMTGSGFGVICALGDGHADANRVKGYCYQSVPSDPNPPLPAAEGPIISDFWQLDSIPGATTGPNILRIWYLRNDTVLYAENRTFNGIAATHTECEARATSHHTLASRCVFLPSQFTVTAAGFSTGLDFFNGCWTLNLQPQPVGSECITWSSESCVADVQVELRSDPRAETVQLRFRRGVTQVRYSKPAADWNPVNVSDFADITTRAVPARASVPATIQVHPGAAP